MNNDPSNKRLTDEENYKTVFTLADVDVCLLVYSRILSNFLKDISEDIDQSHPKYNFIVEKGVETINNVFKTILVHTKNMELAEYHTEKACVYYIEFIIQLMGVEINVREAIIFVYKKTVFEISTDIKKRSFVTAEQNVYFGILNESLSFMNQLSKFRKEHDCLDDYARKISFQNELTDTRMSRLYFLNSLVSGLSILKTSDINFFNVIDAVFKKMKKSSNKNEFVFSMEKLTNAIDNDFSPLKIANQLLLT
jgi:hypothetical protein